MKQTWRNLLFAHWSADPALVRATVPEELELDTFDGRAWIAVVPFLMMGIRGRWMPPVPGLSHALELNVRTYVRHGGRSGVYFYSLDCDSAAAVWGARTFYHLPYERARMSMGAGASDRIEYRCSRTAGSAEFEGSYGPTGKPELTRPGSLEHWLTERYCLFTRDERRRVLIGEIHHAPWPLQPADARIARNTMARAAGIELTGDPLLHYARELEVLIWWPATSP